MLLVMLHLFSVLFPCPCENSFIFNTPIMEGRVFRETGAFFFVLNEFSEESMLCAMHTNFSKD